MYFETECVMALQGHPMSLILVPIESAYTLYFILVINSNFGLILSRFRGFLLKTATPPPIPCTRILGCSLWTGLPMFCLRVRRLQANYLCLYFCTNPTYMATIPQRYRQADRRTDGRLTTAIPRYAHRPSA